MPLSQFENTLSLFNNLVNELIPETEDHWRPALSIYNDKDRFVIECELPGIVMDDLKLDVHDDILEISGERKQAALPDGAIVRADERCAGSFRRRIRLDDSVDRQAIVADYQDGVLVVTAPRVAETLPRRIEVRQSDVH
jgi:HSP20 family protein